MICQPVPTNARPATAAGPAIGGRPIGRAQGGSGRCPSTGRHGPAPAPGRRTASPGSSSASEARTSGQRSRNQCAIASASRCGKFGHTPSARSRLAPALHTSPARRWPRASWRNAARIADKERVSRNGTPPAAEAIAAAAADVTVQHRVDPRCGRGRADRTHRHVEMQPRMIVMVAGGVGTGIAAVAAGHRVPRSRLGRVQSGGSGAASTSSGAWICQSGRCSSASPQAARPASPVLISCPVPTSATISAQSWWRRMMSRNIAASLCA